jgi:hypothetical protein
MTPVPGLLASKELKTEITYKPSCVGTLTKAGPDGGNQLEVSHEDNRSHI